MKSLVSEEGQKRLQQLLSIALKWDGDVAEVGVYQGGIALVLKQTMKDTSKVLHLFDTFCGIPSISKGIDTMSVGQFGDTSLALVEKIIGKDRVAYYVGVFPETARGIEEVKFCFVHVDCDTYQSVKDCCEFFCPRIGSGFIVFDDYKHHTCPGATKAVDEFIREYKGEFIFELLPYHGAVMKFGEAIEKNLEIGCGKKPTPGFLHQDIIKLEGIELDFLCAPYEIPEKDFDLIIAVGVMEHLRFAEVEKTLRHFLKILKDNGVFLFDVPDLLVWCRYYVDFCQHRPVPFEHQHILNTIYGWQRWPGDEHKSGWEKASLQTLIQSIQEEEYRFKLEFTSSQIFKDKGIERGRFDKTADAHLYVKLTRVNHE